MASPALRRHLLVFLAYIALGAAFAWPLPLQMGSALPGQPSGDTGVYVWNIWVFRHELVEHQRFPFFTLEILSLAAPTPLTLHNYTTFANLLAFFALPIFGVVRTFNGLLIFSGALAAYAMYLLARKRSGDDTAAWLAGAAFGFSPFLMARMNAHFSLLQAAPLPIFAWLLVRLSEGASWRVAAAAGAVVAWAYLCDPYYAVYCVLMLVFMLGYAAVTLRLPAERPPWRSGTWAVDLAIVCVASLVAGILIQGGGRIELGGLRMSMRSLYTPVLLLTVLAVVRVLVAMRPRFTIDVPAFARDWRAYAAAAVAGAIALSPVLFTMAEAVSDAGSLGAPVLWRSSARGMDLAAFFAPNPLNPWLAPASAPWIATLPEGFVENVASVPWTILGVLAIGLLVYKVAPPRGWTLWTLWFALLALGPFVHVASLNTHIPTPWVLLRFVPVVSAARMPTRFAVLVAMGVAMLFCVVLAGMRKRSARPALVAWIAGVLLIFELLPAPRQTYSAELPQVFRTIASDPRPLRVLNLPFGLRDGLTSDGNYTALSQFHQTYHEKALIGGYISRLPRARLGAYAESITLRTLIRLSEGGAVSGPELQAALADGAEAIARFEVGWVVIDKARTPPALAAFALDAFDLDLVESAEGYDLYVPRALARPRPLTPAN
jgi:hypothetical protein